MSAAANELLQAVHAVLAGNAALTAIIGNDGIRDRLVTGRRLPAVILAELTTSDFSTATEPGEEHLLVLQVWSDAQGQREVNGIAAIVHALLHDQNLSLATSTLVNLRHTGTRTRREPKTRLFAAEMRFRAVTE